MSSIGPMLLTGQDADVVAAAIMLLSVSKSEKDSLPFRVPTMFLDTGLFKEG